MNSTVHYINVINFRDLLFSNEKLFFIDTIFIFFNPFRDFFVRESERATTYNGIEETKNHVVLHNS